MNMRFTMANLANLPTFFFQHTMKDIYLLFNDRLEENIYSDLKVEFAYSGKKSPKWKNT